jgi:hypothetical protein
MANEDCTAGNGTEIQSQERGHVTYWVPMKNLDIGKDICMATRAIERQENSTGERLMKQVVW